MGIGEVLVLPAERGERLLQPNRLVHRDLGGGVEVRYLALRLPHSLGGRAPDAGKLDPSTGGDCDRARRRLGPRVRRALPAERLLDVLLDDAAARPGPRNTAEIE